MTKKKKWAEMTDAEKEKVVDVATQAVGKVLGVLIGEWWVRRAIRRRGGSDLQAYVGARLISQLGLLRVELVEARRAQAKRP